MRRAPGLVVYFAIGLLFGVVITKAEVVSWYRIQEMFRFQGFHMFGIFATALPVSLLVVQLLKRRGRTWTGEPIVLPPKTLGRGVRYVVGGIVFGVGWALSGACPGPLFALVGSGAAMAGVVLLCALIGTWVYGALRPRLPH